MLKRSQPREEFTNINIHSNGDWYTKDKKIINPQILKYFKSSLCHDNQGIYILNQFGLLSEKGYINVNGPLVFITHLDQKKFYSEINQAIPFSSITHILEYKNILYIPLPILHGYAQISRKIYLEMINLVVENMSQFFFDNIPIQQYKIIDWSY